MSRLEFLKCMLLALLSPLMVFRTGKKVVRDRHFRGKHVRAKGPVKYDSCVFEDCKVDFPDGSEAYNCCFANSPVITKEGEFEGIFMGKMNHCCGWSKKEFDGGMMFRFAGRHRDGSLYEKGVSDE